MSYKPKYVADMHCDTLSKVSAECALVNKYNMSAASPALQLFAAFVPKEGRPPEIRRRELLRLANIYFYETDRLGLRRITEPRHIIDAEYENKPSAMLTVEGGGGLFYNSEELYTLYRGGLRVLGPVWDTNELGCCCYDKEDSGLTDEGKKMVFAAEALGITIDVSHMSDKSFYDLFEISSLPHIATHSNFRAVCNHPRNLTLDMARAIVSGGGIIGLNIYPDFITKEGDAAILHIMKHIDYALEQLGEGATGFGFDIDGTDGKYPAGFTEDSSMHDRLIGEIIKAYPASVVDRLVYQNVLDFFKGCL